MNCPRCGVALDPDVSTEHFMHEHTAVVLVHTSDRCADVLAAKVRELTEDLDEARCICRYCRRVFMASLESAAENPWCRHCLNERLAIASIVSWLRDGAGEIRAKGSAAWEDAIMPIYRELADRIEKREWLSAASHAPRKEG